MLKITMVNNTEFYSPDSFEDFVDEFAKKAKWIDTGHHQLINIKNIAYVEEINAK